jgi:hypothetical protein
MFRERWRSSSAFCPLTVLLYYSRTCSLWLSSSFHHVAWFLKPIPTQQRWQVRPSHAQTICVMRCYLPTVPFVVATVVSRNANSTASVPAGLRNIARWNGIRWHWKIPISKKSKVAIGLPHTTTSDSSPEPRALNVGSNEQDPFCLSIPRAIHCHCRRGRLPLLLLLERLSAGRILLSTGGTFDGNFICSSY